MAKTKKELEFELRITKEMYQQAHEERMVYYFVLSDIAKKYYTLAIDELIWNSDKDLIIKEGETLNQLFKVLKDLNTEKAKKGK